MKDVPIRVLHVVHSMDCGGAENMIMNLYRNIDRNKVQFDFLVHTDDKGFFDDEIHDLGGEIIHVPYYYILNSLEYHKCISKVFEERANISIVHGHLGSCAHIYLKIAKEYGCFTIAQSHNTRPKISLKNAIYRLFTYKTRVVADFFMSCGHEAGDYRFGKHITSNPEKYCILNNAIKTDDFIYNSEIRESVRNEFGVEKDTLFVGHIGRFNYQKNHVFIIKVFESIIKTNSNAMLLLVGEGVLKEEIETIVKSRMLSDKVIFTGLRNDVSRLLQGLDCLLFPSHYEGLPVTLIEAQAASLPCVISDCITNEVSISDLISFIPLSSDLSIWSQQVISVAGSIRCNRKDEIVKAGYDINDTSEWLTRFYINHQKRPI